MEIPPEEAAAALRAAGFRGEIRVREPLAPFTTWRIGGPADVLAQPADAEDLLAAVRWASGTGVAWRIMGNGSNLLVRDEGVRGLVIRLRKVLDGVWAEGARIEAGAGASLPSVANLAASHGLAGLEFAAGIPGTVGGALVMNAGWHAHEIGSVVEWVDVVIGSGDLARRSRAECAFGYRTSRLKDERTVVLRTCLSLERDDPDAIRARMEEYAVSRKANQPTELPSCGSVFLKPEVDFAGRLIEQAGLKGFRIGDLQVSPKHANFFVNLGEGTAADALALVEKVESEVAARFGVRLQREFELW